jgi:hypothetical protein
MTVFVMGWRCFSSVGDVRCVAAFDGCSLYLREIVSLIEA